ncbi:MAG: hypothetical protein ACKOES_06370 [Planctomycetaceae bacterium]
MSLLVDFLCRFAWGVAAGLVLTSPRVVPGGFFRVNLLVVLGLATFAALLARNALPAVSAAAAAAAALAWCGSIAWFAERRRGGMLLCVACTLVLAGATVLVTLTARPGGEGAFAGASVRDGLPSAGIALLSGLVTGLTVHAMLLGHWYLNAPGMRIDALRRAIDVALVAWGARLVTVAVAAVGEGIVRGCDATAVALVALRWLTGLVSLPILLLMSRRTLAIPNTHSATGILYVACLAAILGELTAQLLAVGASGGA